jgi:tetratricopeptide (TPR) repeat protein
MTQKDDFFTLALEGERCCRVGQFGQAVDIFRQALHLGTEDLSLLTAVHAQLGNAFFHLEQYEDALEHHTRDLHIAR